MQYLTNILQLLGGLAMFLYGMNTMGNGLEKAAGNRMGQIIDRLTGNLFKALVVGAGVTALIQSSNATLVMVVGFVNSGIMTLQQSVGVILGAHIGTTITSVIISLNSIGDKLWILNLFKPATLAPLALAAGIVMLLFIKGRKTGVLGEILAGFGVLFIGMSQMSSAMSFLNDLPSFQSFIQQLSNPVFGILTGLLLTVIIQSSSASVGILQAAAAATGCISFPTAAAIILGENLGSCVSALMSSMGATRAAKRAAVLNLMFMAGGMLIATVLLFVLGLGKYLTMWNSYATMTSVSMFHIGYNICNSIVMTFLSRPMVMIVEKLIPDDEADVYEDKIAVSLDERLLATPSLGLNQTYKEVANMMRLAIDNVHICYDILTGKVVKSQSELHEVEDMTDRYESAITQYLIRLTDQKLTAHESTQISSLFHIITDIERIGDHAYTMGNSLIKLADQSDFSDVAKHQIVNMFKAVEKLMTMTLQSFETQDVRLAAAVHPLEDVVDYLEDYLKSEHLERLANKECHFETGIIFLDIVNALKRISDHCSNISLAVEQVGGKEGIDFDPHTHLKYVHENKSDEYTRVYDKYIAKYTK